MRIIVKTRIKRFGIEIFDKKRCIKIKKGITRIVCTVIILFLMYKLVFGMQTFIHDSIEKLSVTNDLNSIWIGSLASYWGGIIGGIISGSFTFLGVAWTIKYYRDSDAEKGRLECMPFLIIETIKQTSFVKESFRYKITSNKLNNNSNKQILHFKVKLTNIGQGFANTLVVYTGENFGGRAYNELIQVNESSDLNLEIHTVKGIYEDEISFDIRYVDSRTNEYIQHYTIQLDSQNLNTSKINNGYPSFIGQTHRIGSI